MMPLDSENSRREIERLLSGNDRLQAREQLTLASAASENDLWLWSAHARIEAEEGNNQVALNAFRHAADLAVSSGSSQEAVMLLEQALAAADASGHGVEILGLLQRLVRVQPDDPRINYRLGRHLYDLGQHQAAIPYLRIAGPVLREQDDAFWLYTTALALTGGYEELMQLEPVMDEMAVAVPAPYGPYRHLALARLSLSFVRVKVLDRIASVEASSAWLDASVLAARIKSAIAASRPFSFIPLADGEARFLSYLSARVHKILRPAELSAMINSIWPVWFGRNIDQFDRQAVLTLGQKILQAVDSADVTGIAGSGMVAADHYHFGFLAEMQGMILKPDGRHYTSALVHESLHGIAPFLKPLLQDLPFIGFVGCHADLAARLAQHCNITRAVCYLVPGESGRMEPPLSPAEAACFPEFHDRILATLEVPFQGAVFLVSAGLPGKVYAARIKELGGIAIDIGRMADRWMGCDIQPGLPDTTSFWTLPPLQPASAPPDAVPEEPVLKLDGLPPRVLMQRERCLDIIVTPEATLAVLEDDSRVEIRRDGGPVTDFGEGWTPTHLYAESWPILLLELRHESGHEATWFLDGDFNVRQHGFAELDFNDKELLRSRLQRGFEAVADHVLRGALAPASGDRGVLRINPGTLQQVLQPVVYREAGRTTIVPLDILASHEALRQETRRGQLVALSMDHVRATMGQRIVDMAAAAIRIQAVSLASPVDGHALQTDISICINNFILAYRFYDKRHDLPFFAVASTHVCKIVALYFPLTNQCIPMNDAESQQLTAQMPFNAIDKALREHVLLFGRRLLPYLQAPSREIAVQCWHDHLGHHLWQELTGLDTLQRALPPEALPPVLVVDTARTEMFGPIDALFPAFAGKVDRSADNVRPMIDLVYRRRLCLISPTDSYVRTALSDRIITLAGEAVDLETDRRLSLELKAAQRPVVLLGLRVENRTVVNFSQFCEDFVEMVRAETGGRAAIVIDGHNSNGAHVFESAGPDGARTPVDVEHEIVGKLQQRFAGSGLIFIDTIGATMHRSIFWGHHCNFFVTPWGAGLAKYKWIANKPGLVLAGQLYQRLGFDLHIYDAAEFLESPTPMTIIDIADVADAPDDIPLILINEPQRCNFRVDMLGVRRKFRTLLAETGSPVLS